MFEVTMSVMRLTMSWLRPGLRRAGSFSTRAGIVAGGLLGGAMSADALAGKVTFPDDGSGILPNLSFSASLTSPPDAPVGKVLQNVSQGPRVKSEKLTCNVQKTVSVNGTAVPGDPKTFLTNVPGIGVRFYITSGWYGDWEAAPVTETLPTLDGTFFHYTRADLVVTGPVGSGVLTTLPSMPVTFSGDCIATSSTTQFINPGTVITGSTCSVTTPLVSVLLPKALSTDLPKNGAKTGSTPFTLGVICPAGVAVKVTLTDATNPGNLKKTLSLAQGSSAQGVGLQILNGSEVVAFGPDSATEGNINQWSAGIAPGGQMQIPLIARYVRTTGPLIPGSVKGTATFTMSYQ